MKNNIHVKKRDGTLELLDYDKIHMMLAQCAEGLKVSVSDVALNAHLKIANKMSSVAIQQTLIKSASEKLTPEHPDYGVLAGRLLVTNMRKEVYGSFEPINFLDYIKKNVKSRLYSPEILEKYSEEEIAYLGSYLDYDNDL
ncbi:MAG: ribonucleotide-diphosphate reductase subunit alpha, partial [Candidatus Marinimicrobia bacterium]|nr:ribonucleotide-diphosphate reductase subunit alpha [Candidatus Neomarinimicrobiota bacterium]